MALEITRRDARRRALAGLIDYAGLFPPASLDMAAAVTEYREVRRSPDAWLVNRFICPAARLTELAGALVASMTPGEAPWSLVVTAAAGDERTVGDFSSEMGRSARVEAVEMPLPPEADVAAVIGCLRSFDRMIYFEVPWGSGAEDGLDLLARAREESGRALGAKIRCGGTTPDAFPPVEAVASFLAAAARHPLPVKATAGLHHPVRHVDPVTGFTHHGFLNLLVAAALAHRGAGEDELAAALADMDPVAFSLTAAGLTWRDERFSADDLEGMRRDGFVGYGSCSVSEPVADLTALGVLPVAS